MPREVSAGRSGGRRSEAAEELREILQSTDPVVANFVARHEALLERVTVLERAIEEASRWLDAGLLGHEDGNVEVHEFRRGEVADLEAAQARLHEVLDA